jgi:5-methylcytosine-specific restriction endonuclease McrA
VNREIRRQVRERAEARCEYCHIAPPAYKAFCIDHVVARQHGGTTALENLAFCCLHCNAHKGPNLAGTDQHTGQLVRLFDPRKDDWAEHFAWSRATLIGLTAIGRATIHVLAINEAAFLEVRQILLIEQSGPPE